MLLSLYFLLHLFLFSEVDEAYTPGVDWPSTLLICVSDASLSNRNPGSEGYLSGVAYNAGGWTFERLI